MRFYCPPCAHQAYNKMHATSLALYTEIGSYSSSSSAMLNTFVPSPSPSESLPGSDDLDFLRFPDELTETPSGSSL